MLDNNSVDRDALSTAAETRLDVNLDDSPKDGPGQRCAAATKRLYLVDPRMLTRDCLAHWLQEQLPEFAVEVLDEPKSSSDVVRGAGVVVYNAGSRHFDDSAAAEMLQRVCALAAEQPLVLIADDDGYGNVVAALRSGVRGYIPSSTAASIVVAVIRLVDAGGSFAPVSALVSASRHGPESVRPAGEPGILNGFTPRQLQILQRIQRGLPNKLIAYELDMCENTVKVHIRAIMRKLRATNRTQVAYLTRDRIVEIA